MWGEEGRTPVITGIGLVTPAGTTQEDSWESIQEGKNCLGPPHRVDQDAAAQYSAYVTGEVDDFDTADVPSVDERSMGRYTAFAIAATMEALDDADLNPETTHWNGERIGVSVSSAFGGLEEVLDEYDADRSRVSSYLATKTLVNLAAGHVGIVTGARGPNRAPATACAAGTHAVDAAMTDIVRERADVMLAGGTESVMNYYGIAMTAAARAHTSQRNPNAVRPFGEHRDGLALGEGAAMLVVEAEEHARSRDVEPYARLTGVGATGDGHHPVSPPNDGDGLQRAMKMALEDADVSPETIDYVNAHGTATVAGDQAEARAVEHVLGTETPVTSVKGTIGHTYGAAGAIDIAIAALSIHDDLVPATANLETVGADVSTPVVTERREQDVDAVLSNSAGFGGTNGAIVLED